MMAARAIASVFGATAMGAAVLGVALLAGCGKQAEPVPVVAVANANNAEQIKRGRYLAKAADCAACHTSANGAPFAGGVELASPFGTFYGTNITPDKEHGIGKWSAAQFYAALRDGVTPDRHLYPAMPYTSYRSMTRADSDAIYAYLMQTRPVAVKSRDAELSFPYNMRFGVRFWNMLFLKDSLPDASAGQSAAWQRGRYLSNTLGHCAECHTPRGMLGQLDMSKTLTGNALARIGAPDISPAGLSAAGWNRPDLASFLGTGVAPQGSAYGEMFAVVHLSTQYLAPQDLDAMTTYLLGDKPLAPQALKPVVAAAGELDAGRGHYIAVCAGCHGVDGGGKPHVAVAMQGNTTVRNADPHNLIAVILDGIAAQHFGAKENMQEMPGFAHQLSDKEIAELSNFMRMGWGGQAAKVSELQVKALRIDGVKHH